MTEPTAGVQPPGEGVGTDSAISLQDELVRGIQEALDSGELEKAGEMLDGLHSADVADVLHLVGPDHRRLLVELVREHLDADVLVELNEPVRAEIVAQLGPRATAAALADLETDEAVDVVDTLDDATQAEVLDALEADQRASIEEGLAYPEDSAGRLMQRDLVAIPSFWTIGQTIDHLRESGDLPDEFFELFVVDPAHHPIGTVPLNRAMRTRRPVEVNTIMDDEPRIVPVDMDQEEVAFLFEQYDLASAPVVDDSGRLVGVIMIDDVVDIILEEAEEDILRLGGVSESGRHDSVFKTTRRRFPWLLVNLVTAVLASAVIAFFEGTIEQIVALAVLMPIVASMGGNVGTQTLTITVRGLATRDLTRANAFRLFGREIVVSLINAVLFAVLAGAVAFLWFDSAGLALVILAAMVVNILVAGLAGMAIPLGLNRIGVDPALAATVFVTTITDVVGFSAFLGLAAWLLL